MHLMLSEEKLVRQVTFATEFISKQLSVHKKSKLFDWHGEVKAKLLSS